MLLEPDRFRHTPPIAPERTYAPTRPTVEAKRLPDTPTPPERDVKPPPDKG
jgi:hypothetical protein